MALKERYRSERVRGQRRVRDRRRNRTGATQTLHPLPATVRGAGVQCAPEAQEPALHAASGWSMHDHQRPIHLRFSSSHPIEGEGKGLSKILSGFSLVLLIE